MQDMMVRSTTPMHLWNKVAISYLRYPSLSFVHGSYTSKYTSAGWFNKCNAYKAGGCTGAKSLSLSHIVGSARNNGTCLVNGGIGGVEMSLAIEDLQNSGVGQRLESRLPFSALIDDGSIEDAPRGVESLFLAYLFLLNLVYVRFE